MPQIRKYPFHAALLALACAGCFAAASYCTAQAAERLSMITVLSIRTTIGAVVLFPYVLYADRTIHIRIIYNPLFFGWAALFTFAILCLGFALSNGSIA